jgi:hypothetical protein
MDPKGSLPSSLDPVMSQVKPLKHQTQRIHIREVTNKSQNNNE